MTATIATILVSLGILSLVFAPIIIHERHLRFKRLVEFERVQAQIRNQFREI